MKFTAQKKTHNKQERYQNNDQDVLASVVCFHDFTPSRRSWAFLLESIHGAQFRPKYFYARFTQPNSVHRISLIRSALAMPAFRKSRPFSWAEVQLTGRTNLIISEVYCVVRFQTTLRTRFDSDLTMRHSHFNSLVR
jgi:hypothetical protein